MPPLLNANAILQCAHGGLFTVVPRGPRPLVGGAPVLTVTDFPGVVAAGCAFNVAGAPAPCVIASVTAGICATVLAGGTPVVNQTVSCISATGFPSLPCSSAGQVTVQA
jgi:hypothetical protein